jgi:hypothetical protein
MKRLSENLEKLSMEVSKARMEKGKGGVFIY